jgi:hypothetical protein
VRSPLSAVQVGEIDVASFRRSPDLIDGLDIYLVVKSCDQRVRRRRLIERKSQGAIGRISRRPVADGLLVRAIIRKTDRIDFATATSATVFREPRDLLQIGDGRRYLTEIGRVVEIGATDDVVRAFINPYFGFLHSLDLAPDGRHCLVVSSGYDAIFEIDLETGKTTWEWFGWEHGFDKRADNVHLTRKVENAAEFEAKKVPYVFVDAIDYGEQGLVTAGRAMHASGAHYASGGDEILVTLGQRACAIAIDRSTGHARTVVQGLRQLPHGMTRFDDGWIITNTTAGEIWFLDSNYRVCSILSVRNLPGKPAEAEGHEWLQTSMPVDRDLLVSVDANRGLIAIAPERRLVGTYPVDEDWSVQTACPVLVR